MLTPWKKSYDQPREHFKKQRHYFVNKGPSSQSYGFSSSHVWMWELDYKERVGSQGLIRKMIAEELLRNNGALYLIMSCACANNGKWWLGPLRWPQAAHGGDRSSLLVRNLQAVSISGQGASGVSLGSRGILIQEISIKRGWPIALAEQQLKGLEILFSSTLLEGESLSGK